MHIYFSPLLELDLKNKFTKGRDFTSTEASATSDKALLSSFDDLKIPCPGAQSELKKSKTTDPSALCKAVSQIQDELSERIKTEATQLGDEDQLWGYRDLAVPHLWIPLAAEYQPHLLPGYPPVVAFRYEQQLSITETYNLFSNFGNIERILKKAAQFYVVFSEFEFAAAAKEHLTGLCLFGQELEIDYAVPEDLEPKPRQFTESIVYDTSYDRFNLSKPLSINAPSEVLHVSNLKKESCTEARLRKLFEGFGEIQKIQLLLNIKDKYMALVKMPDLSEALNATAVLHNREVSGRRVHISFTKSKI